MTPLITPQEIVRLIEQRGGRLKVREGGVLICENPDAAAPYLEQIGEHKTAIIDLVRSRGPDSTLSPAWKNFIREGLKGR